MLRKGIRVMIMLSGAVLTLFPACYKSITVKTDTTEEITRPVGFAQDIIPIFNGSCSLTGCHGKGGHVPDLSASSAYSSLIVGNYVDTANPKNSQIYLWLTGQKSTQMPPSGKNDTYNALILAWIEQGAKNN